MKFVSLVNAVTGRELFVAVEHVVAIEPAQNDSRISFVSGWQLEVKGTPDEVRASLVASRPTVKTRKEHDWQDDL